jgi:protein-arginine kinase activator protein McsA
VEANALEFERAAVLRDQIKELKEKKSPFRL